MSNSALTGNVVVPASAGSVEAWVSFDGTGSSPTSSINASGNITSVTDNGTGDYTLNFTTALTDAHYAAAGFVKEGTSTGATRITQATAAVTKTASAFRFYVSNGSITFNAPEVTMIIVR